MAKRKALSAKIHNVLIPIELYNQMSQLEDARIQRIADLEAEVIRLQTELDKANSLIELLSMNIEVLATTPTQPEVTPSKPKLKRKERRQQDEEKFGYKIKGVRQP